MLLDQQLLTQLNQIILLQDLEKRIKAAEIELNTLSEQRKVAVIRRRLAYQRKNTLKKLNLHRNSSFVNSKSNEI